ncbi:DUF3014 domain-containing protein [Usitatibacter palustris]|uniref:DUF3014 domain-containing protein n=1 Tax=Usitatibacter palustris TaxID=2732487 RepID=A0A6M4HAL1_9PROT|nr:DUF3014 domain-containing protein [Usitatibacter palustris]QJR16690.1 hypothetical protein DSM104440_03526 [Usitatibacter palustris]
MDRIEPTLGDDDIASPRRDYATRVPSRKPIPVGALVVFVVAIVGGAAYYFWPRETPPPPASTPAVATPAAPPKAEAEGPKYPVTVDSAPPLPSLKESDGPVAAAISTIIGLDAFARTLLTENLVRNIVATVDNLPSEAVSRRINPVRPVPGVPTTSGKDDTLTLAPSNSTRYAFYMRVMESTDTNALVAFYRRHYPLFQEAYVELGYPNKYFNDRLVAVLDHLLATPDTSGPIMLRQPKVLLEYADPTLEERSAGQKILLRIGKENRDKVKVKLREIRAAVASDRP